MEKLKRDFRVVITGEIETFDTDNDDALEEEIKTYLNLPDAPHEIEGNARECKITHIIAVLKHQEE